MMYTSHWARSATSGLFKSKLDNYNEVLDPNNPYAIYNKALRMISAVDITTSDKTRMIVGNWVSLCIKRLRQTNHKELISDILHKAASAGVCTPISYSY